MFKNIKRTVEALRLIAMAKRMAGACMDCGRRYGAEYGFPDLIIPDEVWKAISPTADDSGLLCPCCILRRLYAADIQTTGQFMSGPLKLPETIAIEAWIDSISSWSKGDKFNRFGVALKDAIARIPELDKFAPSSKTKKFDTLPTEANLTKQLREIMAALTLIEDLTHRKMPETQGAYDAFAKDVQQLAAPLKTFNITITKNTKRGVKKYRVYLPPKQPRITHAKQTVHQLGYNESSLKRFRNELVKLDRDLPRTVRATLKSLKTFDAQVKTDLGLEVFTEDDGKLWFIDMGLGLTEGLALFILIRLPYVIYDTIADVEQLASVYKKSK